MQKNNFSILLFPFCVKHIQVIKGARTGFHIKVFLFYAQFTKNMLTLAKYNISH